MVTLMTLHHKLATIASHFKKFILRLFSRKPLRLHLSEFFDRRGRKNQKKTDRTTGILYDPLLLLDMFSYLRTQNPSEAGKRAELKRAKKPFYSHG